MIGINQLALLNAFASRDNGKLTLHTDKYDHKMDIQSQITHDIQATLPLKTNGERNEQSLWTALEALKRDGFVEQDDPKCSGYSWNNIHSITDKGRAMLAVAPPKDVAKVAKRFTAQRSVKHADNPEYFAAAEYVNEMSSASAQATAAWSAFSREHEGMAYASGVEVAAIVAQMDDATRQQVVDLTAEVGRSRTAHSLAITQRSEVRAKVREQLQSALTFALSI